MLASLYVLRITFYRREMAMLTPNDALVERVECSVPQLHSLGIAAGIGVVQARHGLTDGADLFGCQGQCVEHEGRWPPLSARPPHIALMFEQRVLSRCFNQVGDCQIIGAGRL